MFSTAGRIARSLKRPSWITSGAQCDLYSGFACRVVCMTDVNSVNSATYRNQRCFSDQPHQKVFLDIFKALINNRLAFRWVFAWCWVVMISASDKDVKLSFDFSEWMENSSSDGVLRVLNCLRLLIRDPVYQVGPQICFFRCHTKIFEIDQ